MTMKMFTYFMVGFIDFAILGCVSYHPTERAAVVVFNDLTQHLKIWFTLSGKQTPEESIRAREFKYIYEYEEDPDKPVELPPMLTSIQIDIPPACQMILSRDELTGLFVRDPEGRRTWDLHIGEAFLKEHGC